MSEASTPTLRSKRLPDRSKPFGDTDVVLTRAGDQQPRGYWHEDEVGMHQGEDTPVTLVVGAKASDDALRRAAARFEVDLDALREFRDGGARAMADPQRNAQCRRDVQGSHAATQRAGLQRSCDQVDAAAINSENDLGDELISEGKIEVAIDAAAFISRLVDYFQTAAHPGTMGDLRAIHQSASVIMSALGDAVEKEDSLRDRYERALESASVILLDQPAQSSGVPQGLQTNGQVVLKKNAGLRAELA